MNLFKAGGMGVFFLLTACGLSESKLITYINQVKARKPKMMEAFVLSQPKQTLNYAVKAKERNPFKPRNDSKPAFAKNIANPMHTIALHSLTLVGVLQQGFSIGALVKQSGGKLVLLKVGDQFNNGEGRVVRIDDYSIEIEEKKRRLNHWSKSRIKISLLQNSTESSVAFNGAARISAVKLREFDGDKIA